MLYSHHRKKRPLMPDNHRRYFAIQKALLRLMPQIKGHAACHLMTLTALICGSVGSKSAPLPAIANKMPGPAKRQSRITTFERWLKNDKVTVDCQLYGVYLDSLSGRGCQKQGWLGHIHRRTRCDLSLFQIGLLWLEHCLNEGFALWVAFRLPPVRRLRFSGG